ncbi:YbaB/EbfC family nucleoid-associated protein [Actinokineospora sp. NBRC 105648]|uniref:YbaB/EbfC family nucleoid-associated protein n=1 Tax=Actinokineospora sp. NBRC 105648 TaxID=3032206 RepID=UPI0024A030C8|nr:YbaB/EbfC family nucleoid-associated protein [Actinokineospora sp. NBRC 105648]GLZ38945.1 hypothetical protein Acsp05_25690 [Actinokineospora sp. NBRC 105648]
MSTPLHNEMAAALTELREQQAKITSAVDRVAASSTTAVSEDHVVEATVDGQGKVTGIKFTGRRWRDMAPKELAARLVEVIGRAQDQAAAATSGIFAEMMPGGMMPQGFDLSDMDTIGSEIAAMFDAAVKDSGKWSQ